MTTPNACSHTHILVGNPFTVPVTPLPTVTMLFKFSFVRRWSAVEADATVYEMCFPTGFG